MSDKTRGKPAKKTVIINQCKINDFDAMIKETLEAMDRVLKQREDDLTFWKEDEQKQNEFFQIFGSKGERVIQVDMPLRGKSNIVGMEAKDVMLDCIRRLKWIRSQLTPNSFINRIYDPDNPNDPTNSKLPRDPKAPRTFAAYVNSEQQSDFQINIGINFTGRINDKNMRVCSTVMGARGRVSTLVHELSHFEKNFTNPTLGGMGTLDYEADGSKPLPNQDNSSYQGHLDGAALLVREKSEDVFNNSYNIEKYFEIEL
ncbi:TPA: hypothetical protein J1W43_003790 [Escherichia coli]|nr:hypothetical protein [Escherichia coli]HBA8269877.1 hypothetical protein [Escherichia coli]HBA8732725.1 hypothetical protein [Escherichia coli]HBB8628811.1 hypothetical protein [Escherichia coli]